MPPDGSARSKDTTGKFVNTAHEIRTPSVPPQVEDSVPYCAQRCLASYISQQYNCPQNDFTCLCGRYSSEGFTLGEFAYICLEQECATTNSVASLALYYICSEKTNAVQPTHRTLTVSPTSAVSTMPRTETEPRRTVTSTGTVTPHHGFTQASSTSESNLHHSTTIHTLPHSSRGISAAATKSSSPRTMAMSTGATAASATSTSDLDSTGLTSAQAVGVSLGAMGAVILAVAAIYFFVCFRRRKVTRKEGRESYDFVDETPEETPPRVPPYNYGHADPRGPLGGFRKPRAELNEEKRNPERQGESERQRNVFPGEMAQRQDNNVDISPDSAMSFESMRTLSQLLPDKPDPTPPRPPPKSPAPSAYTGGTEFEEDNSWPLRSQNFPAFPLPPKAAHYPAVRDSQHPPSARKKIRSSQLPRHPALSLEIPKQAARSPTVPAPAVFPPLPPPPPLEECRRSQQRESSASNSRSSKSDGSVLNYYASPLAGSLASPEVDSPTPIEAEIQRRRAVPTAITVTKPTYPPRAIRESAGSDTSFESDDGNEPTPPEEEDKQLTPVQESPLTQYSPIAGIRYPKVPRSSNQTVPRSPKPSLSPREQQRLEEDRTLWLTQNEPVKVDPQDPVTPQRQSVHASTLSGSTLAAKRRGDSAAHEMGLNLHIPESVRETDSSKSDPKPGEFEAPRKAPRTPRQESPLKGYGRVANSGRNTSGGPPNSHTNRRTPQLLRGTGLPGEPQEFVVKSPHWGA